MGLPAWAPVNISLNSRYTAFSAPNRKVLTFLLGCDESLSAELSSQDWGEKGYFRIVMGENDSGGVGFYPKPADKGPQRLRTD